MRIGGPPRVAPKPAATDPGPAEDIGGSAPAKQTQTLGGGQQAKTEEPRAKGQVSPGFGVTDDATDDINPLTSNKSRIEDGKEGLDGIQLPKGGDVGMLPSEMAEVVDLAPPVEPAAAMEQAFDAAAADMDRGIKAQKAMKGGKKRGAAEEEEEELDGTGDVESGALSAKGAGGLDESWDNWGAPVAAKDGIGGQLDGELQRSRLMGKEGMSELFAGPTGDKQNEP